MNQSACQRESLLHTRRELCDQTVLPRREADALQEIFRPKSRAPAVQAETARKKTHVLGHRHIVIGAEAVRHKTDEPLCARRVAAHVNAAHQKFPRIRCEKPCRNAEQRRLTGAVLPHEPEERPPRHRKREPLQHLQIPVRLPDIRKYEHYVSSPMTVSQGSAMSSRSEFSLFSSA